MKRGVGEQLIEISCGYNIEILRKFEEEFTKLIKLVVKDYNRSHTYFPWVGKLSLFPP